MDRKYKEQIANDDYDSRRNEKRNKTVHNIIICIMLVLFLLSSSAFGEKSLFFSDFFFENGMWITFVVCILWVVGGLIDLPRNKVGGNALSFSIFCMVLSIGSKLFNYKQSIQSPDDLAELASSIILVATAMAYIMLTPSKKK